MYRERIDILIERMSEKEEVFYLLSNDDFLCTTFLWWKERLVQATHMGNFYFVDIKSPLFQVEDWTFELDV